MRGNARKTVDTIYLKSEILYREIKARKDAKNYLKMMGPVSKELHEQYVREVIPYWKKYNMKPAECVASKTPARRWGLAGTHIEQGRGMGRGALGLGSGVRKLSLKRARWGL